MYPPVLMISRVLETDIEIQERMLPAGTQMNVFIWALHHNPEVWENHMVRILCDCKFSIPRDKWN